MTVQLGIATFVGAAMFPFLIRMLWGRFVEKFGEIGGFLSALFIVGVMWAVNHGFGMIHQTGAWVDMGLAAGVGLLVCSLMRGAKWDEHTTRNVVSAIIGGILAGIVLNLAG